MSQPVANPPIGGEPAAPQRDAPAPVAALPYSTDAGESVAVVAMKGLAVAAAVLSGFSILRVASVLWIHFSPTRFQGVATGWQPGTWLTALHVAMTVLSGVAHASVVGGAAAYLRCLPAARRLIWWGAAVAVVVDLASVAMSMLSYPLLSMSGGEVRSAIVMTVWRVQWLAGPLVPHVLLLLLLGRADVRRWLAGGGALKLVG